MNTEMAYLLGMILGNGEMQRGPRETTITIEIPHKNLYTDDLKDVSIYVKASIVDIRSIIEPLIGHSLIVSQTKHSTKISFTSLLKSALTALTLLALSEFKFSTISGSSICIN